MKKISYLVLTLLLLLVISACGQATSDNMQEENLQAGTDIEKSQTKDETNEEVEQPVESNEETTEVTNEVEVLSPINLYFSDLDLMNIYRVKVDTELTKDSEGLKEALQLWINGPEPTKDGLTSLLPEGVTVQSIENIDDVLHVSFSNELRQANLGSSGESFLIQQITMVIEQFGYNEVFILIDGEIDTEFLGHVGLDQIFTANSPEDYELYKD